MAKTKSKSAPDGLRASPTHLLHRALQLALDFHSEAAGPSAPTQRQYTVLVAAGAGEGLTQNDLVRVTGIDRSTLADLVARMLSKGLLERERSATDARANLVRLSEIGRGALSAAAAAAAQADASLLALVGPKKRDGFLKALVSLANHADGAPLTKTKTSESDKPSKKKTKKAKKSNAIAAELV